MGSRCFALRLDTLARYLQRDCLFSTASALYGVMPLCHCDTEAII